LVYNTSEIQTVLTTNNTIFTLKYKRQLECIKTTVLCTFILLCSFSSSHAKIVSHASKDGRPLIADFKEGDVNRPAILVLHGFLQTFSFKTTASITDAISSLGYAVLAPNLSLGVSSRIQSVQCKAAHQHTFKNDLLEINSWIKWLKAKGHKSFVLVGHSWGNLHSIGYSAQYSNSSIKAVIAISLVRTQVSQQIINQQILAAQKLMKQKSEQLVQYKLSYCTNFTATPQSYLSYAKWNNKHIIRTMKHLKKKKLPIYIINGSKDNRINSNWTRTLKANTKQVSVIEGANHFFASVYELELADSLEEVIAQITKKK